MAGRAGRFLRRTAAMAHKETLHLVRDARNLYLVIGLPIVLLFIFGYGVSFDLDDVPVAVVDQDDTATSRRFADALTASGELRLVDPPADPSGADRLFRTQAAFAVFVVPRGFEAAVARGDAAAVQILLDGADGTAASSVLGTSVAILRDEAVRIATGAAPVPGPLDPRVRVAFNPALRSPVFLVPGLIAYILVMVGVLMTALTVAREWERGNMEQLFATPVGRLEIVLGKLGPYLVIGMVQALLVLTVGTLVFDVPVRGSLGLLGAGAVLFLLGVLGQGLFISVVTRNQQVATQVGAVTSLLPGVLLSGFAFPIENMPFLLQIIASIFPARYFVDILRGVLLKGAGFDVLWPKFLALVVFAAAMIALSTARFRRRIA